MNDKYFGPVCAQGYYSKPDRLRFYLEEYLFKGIDFNGKSVLDIGGGIGLFSYYAALKGASNVVVMEPETDGSSAGMIQGFQGLKRLLGNPVNISLTTDVLETFDRRNNKFDIILMHNSINHIDEDACVNLPTDKAAQDKYLAYFDLLREVAKPGAILIVCDCANHNFWVKLLGRNPLAPTIEWQKHQPPQFWAKLLAKRGFHHQSTKWSSPNMLGIVGRLLLGNRMSAYLTYSHFRLQMILN